MNVKYSVAVMLLAISFSLSAQTLNYQLRDSLSSMSSKIWRASGDSSKLAVSDNFLNTFFQMMNDPGNRTFTFDSITGITRVADAKNMLQIFTWNVPFADGTFAYAGLVRLQNPEFKLIALRSKTCSGIELEQNNFSSADWYGALYYKLIETKIAGKQAYTLLGWDGNTAQSNRKLIDIITVDGGGGIHFGFPVFNTSSGLKKRIVYEYADNANMTLRYDKQPFAVQQDRKPRYKTAWLIVSDHLVPMAANMEGLYKYYVPSGETYDGFFFKHGLWNFTSDVQVKVNIPKHKR